MKEKQKEERMNQYISEEVMGIFAERFSSRFKLEDFLTKEQLKHSSIDSFPDTESVEYHKEYLGKRMDCLRHLKDLESMQTLMGHIIS